MHFFAGTGVGVGAGPGTVWVWVTTSVGPLPESGTLGPAPVSSVPCRGPKAVGVKVTRTVQLRACSITLSPNRNAGGSGQLSPAIAKSPTVESSTDQLSKNMHGTTPSIDGLQVAVSVNARSTLLVPIGSAPKS